jgi:ADP-ribosylglycohydrolase
MRNFVKDALFGLATGDALGVPVEFIGRGVLQQKPVTGMWAYGTHRQPAGTWSDDSSLTFCLAESLCKGYDLQDMANRFVNWWEHNYWTPHGKVFDIGIATNEAIQRLANGNSPLLSGNSSENSNGNGSLMRILPLAFYVKNMPIEKRFELVSEVSSITHAHIRSVLSCFIYIEMALQLMAGTEKFEAFDNTGKIINDFLKEHPITAQVELDKFHRILLNPVSNYEIKPVYEYEEVEINSSGYVLHSLEASFWCLLKCNSYAETVLKAVNMGSDTDTTAAIAGGLAGLLYGYEAIPAEWVKVLVRKDDIEDLANRLNEVCL